jgi:tRNA modification GTPase
MPKNRLRTIKPRVAYRKIIFDENKEPFDDVVLTLYKGPESYTGEDVLEISCHGSPYILKYIVDLCINYGACPAGPGEFTRRAFINGKIDLMQAESVANMVSASSHRGVNIALNGLRGSLSKEINVMRDEIIDVLSYSEHLLDVSEDDLTDTNIAYIIHKTSRTQEKVQKLLKNYNTCRIMTSGAVVVLCGPTNSGKSTLFNSLIGSDRAIVHQEPGTTRDLLDAMIIIDGVPITLVDTAGLREVVDDVESEGIRRAEDYINKADLICIIKDITQGSLSSEMVDNILLEKNQVVNIYNKIDLITKREMNKYRGSLKRGLYTSALMGLGLDELKKYIVTNLNLENNTGENFGITTPRQYNAIINSDASITAVLEITKHTPIQLELVSFELQNALQNIEDLLGLKTADEILDRMFESFCVGK